MEKRRKNEDISAIIYEIEKQAAIKNQAFAGTLRRIRLIASTRLRHKVGK